MHIKHTAFFLNVWIGNHSMHDDLTTWPIILTGFDMLHVDKQNFIDSRFNQVEIANVEAI